MHVDYLPPDTLKLQVPNPASRVLKSFCSNKNSKSPRCILRYNPGRYSRIQNVKSFSSFFEGWKRINMRCSITNSAQTGFGRSFLELLSSHYLQNTDFLAFWPHQKDTLFCFNDFKCYCLLAPNPSTNQWVVRTVQDSILLLFGQFSFHQILYQQEISFSGLFDVQIYTYFSSLVHHLLWVFSRI